MTLQQLEKFYKDCMRTGRLPNDGLCNCLGRSGIRLFKPTLEDVDTLIVENKSKVYWAADSSDEELRDNNWALTYAFTPLRQTIVLFLIEIKKHPI